MAAGRRCWGAYGRGGSAKRPFEFPIRLLTIQNPTQRLPQFHAGESAALALAQEAVWWLLINEQRALTYARQQGVKAVTVLKFVIYFYEAQMLSYRSALAKVEGLAPNTGPRVLQPARAALAQLAQRRGER